MQHRFFATSKGSVATMCPQATDTRHGCLAAEIPA